MEESEHDVGSLELLGLYANEHYLARNFPLEYHLGTVSPGVEECPQHNADPAKFPRSTIRGGWLSLAMVHR